jgi:hypothetical protein
MVISNTLFKNFYLIIILADDDDDDEPQSSEESDSNDSNERRARRHPRSTRRSSDEDSSTSALSQEKNKAIPSSQSPISSKRQEEFLDRVGSGISNSSAQVIDLSIEFNGPKKVYLVATAAYADSEVDEKARVLLYLRRSSLGNSQKAYEACMTATTKFPNVPMLNLEKALKADPTSYLNVELELGEKCGSSAGKIHLQSKMQQSQKRQKYVREHPVTRQCMKQMERDQNQILPACLNATISANLLDVYKYKIKFDNVPKAVKNATYKAYEIMRYMARPQLSEDFISVDNNKNEINIQINVNPDLKSKNISIQAPIFNAEITNVRMPRPVRAFMIQHPQLTPDETLGNELLRMQYNRKYFSYA